jgi:predicted DNA-binding transcriptional regulator AlpA
MKAINQQILSELRAIRADLQLSHAELLTLKQTAQLLSMAEKTVRNQLSAGTFPIAVRRAAGGLRFRRVDVETYVAGLGGE